MTYVPPPQQPPQPMQPSVARYGTGVPMQPPPRPKSKVPVWLWVIGAIFGVCCVTSLIIGVVTTLKGEKPSAAGNQTPDRPAAVTESAPAPAATTQAPPSPAAPAVPAGPKTSFGPGMYEVGVEVKAGTYTCTATGAFGAYWERAKNASGEFDAIIANGNIKAGTQGIVTIKAKEFFKIDRGDCVIR